MFLRKSVLGSDGAGCKGAHFFETPWDPCNVRDTLTPDVSVDAPLGDVFSKLGLGEFVPAFEAEDVQTLAEAASLSLSEVRAILETHGFSPTVGYVRRCFNAIALAMQQAKESQDNALHRSVDPTPKSVWPRTFLRLGASDLKEVMVARLSAETVFASLMLTIAFAAILAPPDSDGRELCAENRGAEACDALMCAYIATWGVAVACFTTSCIVSLGSVQLFFGAATEDTIHFMFVSSQSYSSLSFTLIFLGLALGLMPGACINLFLRLPDFPLTCVAVSVIMWFLWAFSVKRGSQAIRLVYGHFPGYYSIKQFMLGYIFSTRATLVMARPGARARTEDPLSSKDDIDPAHESHEEEGAYSTTRHSM